MGKSSKRTAGRRPGRFRIIGGQWRGRRFEFDTNADIRPTPDRVRETLFNWLQPVIDGAVCLDLYAGSGALGLEALSRGAARSVFVDREATALRCIGAHLEVLGCDNAVLVHAAAETYLAHTEQRFDLILLDPPFGSPRWDRVLPLIEGRRLLRAGGRVYLENLVSDGPPPLPDGWQLERSKRAGRVGYYLASMAVAES